MLPFSAWMNCTFFFSFSLFLSSLLNLNTMILPCLWMNVNYKLVQITQKILEKMLCLNYQFHDFQKLFSFLEMYHKMMFMLLLLNCVFCVSFFYLLIRFRFHLNLFRFKKGDLNKLVMSFNRGEGGGGGSRRRNNICCLHCMRQNWMNQEREKKNYVDLDLF